MGKAVRNISYSGLAIAALMISGCSSFNPQVQHIAFAEGRPYLVPAGASYGIISQGIKDIPAYNNRYDCEVGGVVWGKPSVKNEYIDCRKKEDASTCDDILVKAFEEGTQGCSYALSVSEYNSYMNQEREIEDQNTKNYQSIMQGMSNLTNQLNTMNYQTQQRINSYQGFDASKGLNFKGYGY